MIIFESLLKWFSKFIKKTNHYVHDKIVQFCKRLIMIVAVMLPDDAKYDKDDVVMEAVVEKYVMYFKSILHHNNRYFATFFICEMANVILVSISLNSFDV